MCGQPAQSTGGRAIGSTASAAGAGAAANDAGRREAGAHELRRQLAAAREERLALDGDAERADLLLQRRLELLDDEQPVDRAANARIVASGSG